MFSATHMLALLVQPIITADISRNVAAQLDTEARASDPLDRKGHGIFSTHPLPCGKDEQRSAARYAPQGKAPSPYTH
jgi:hypothetical protein